MCVSEQTDQDTITKWMGSHRLLGPCMPFSCCNGGSSSLVSSKVPLLLLDKALGGGRVGGGRFQWQGTCGGEEGVSGGSTSRERDTADTACVQRNRTGCTGDYCV